MATPAYATVLAEADLVATRGASAPRELTIKRDLVVKRADDDLQLAFAEVYAPDDVDTQGEYMSVKSVRDLAHRFLLKNANDRIDVMHDNRPGRAAVVTSFVNDETIGSPHFTKDAWVLGVKVFDRDLWLAMKRGEFSGFSFQARVRKETKVVEMPAPGELLGTTFAAKRDGGGLHHHEFMVLVDKRGNVVSGRTDEVDGHYHSIHENTRTGVEAGHRHTMSIAARIKGAA